MADKVIYGYLADSRMNKIADRGQKEKMAGFALPLHIGASLCVLPQPNFAVQ